MVLSQQQVGEGRRSVVLVTEIAILLAGVVPVLLILSTPKPADGAWGGVLTLIISGIRYAMLIGAGERRLIEMTFWLFTYVFFGLAQVVQLRTGVDPSTTPGLVPQSKDSATLIVLASVIAFIAGNRLRKNRAGRPQAPSHAVVEVSSFRLMLLTGLSITISGYYISRVGLGTLFSSREALSIKMAEIWPDPTVSTLVAASAAMMPLISFVGLVQLRRQRPATTRSALTMVILVVGLWMSISVNPVSSPRYIFGTVALGALAALGMYATPRRFRIVALSALLAMVLVFPLADAFRRSGSQDFEGSNPLVSLTSGDFDAYAQVSNTALYVEKNGSTNGLQALGVALFWVPRSVWSSKPTDTGILLAESRGYDFTNLSAPVQAELYINGVWPALLLGMGVVGWFVRRWDDRVSATLELTEVRAPSVPMCVIPFYLIIILRGSLLQAVAYLAVISLASMFISTRNRSASDP